MNPRTKLILSVLQTPLPDADVFEITYCYEANKYSAKLEGFLLIKDELKNIYSTVIAPAELESILNIAGKSIYHIDINNNIIKDTVVKKQLLKARISLPECVSELVFDSDTKTVCFGEDLSDFLRSTFQLETTK